MESLKNSAVARVAGALVYGHALWLALVALLGAIGAGYAATRDALAPSVVAVLMLLAFASLIGISVCFVWLYERGKRRRMRDRSPEQLAEQVFVWLRKYRLPAVPSRENAEADIEIDIAGPMPVKIVRLRDKPFVTVVGDISFEEDRRVVLRPRALRVRHEMIEALNTQPGIEYVPEYAANGEMVKAQVQCALPFDDTTHEIDLLMAIRAVRATLVRVAAVWGRHLEEVRPGSSLMLAPETLAAAPKRTSRGTSR